MPALRLSIRGILLIVVGLLTLIIAGLAAKDVQDDWRRWRDLRELEEASSLSDQLFDATEKLAVERDVALSMLHAADSETIEEMSARLTESRQAVDAALGSTMAMLTRYPLPDLSELVARIGSRLDVIRALRPEIDKALALPRAGRTPALSERWSAELTALVVDTQDLWVGFVGHYTDIDPIVTQHLWLKHYLRTITDYTGRERSLIGQLIAENVTPTQAQVSQLLRGEGIVETSWQMSRIFAIQGKIYPAIAPEYGDASSHYSTMHDMIQDMFYVVDAHPGSAETYPIGLDLWFELSTQAADTLGVLRDSTIGATRAYVSDLISELEREIAIRVAIFAVALLLCGYSFFVISRRVIRPINQMVGALLQASRGEPVATLPASEHNDEMAKLAQVLNAFQRNVEDIKRTSADLDRSQTRLRAVFETAVDGVVLTGEGGELRILNPACVRLFGYETGDVLGQGIQVLIPALGAEPDDLSAARVCMHDFVGAGQEMVGRRKDGSLFPISVSIGASLQGADTVFVGVVHDLTGRKRTENQLVQAQKMEAVGQLTGGVAHDFNNMLTIIIGNLEFMETYLEPGSEMLEPIQMALRASLRGADLTRQLLAFSRRQPLEPRAFDLNALVASTTGLLGRTLGERIEIRLRLREGLNTAVADPAQVESALANLAINARDAMPGGGQLTIETANVYLDEGYAAGRTDVTPGEYVMLAVSDTGHGMPPEVLDRVFEPFFTTKPEGKGTGLGLSMVYGFAKQSHGHLIIYSEVGHGTTVRLYLPRTGGEAESRSDEALPDAVPAQAEAILVVEDNPDVRRVAVRLLRELGYKIVEAEAGAEALAILGTDQPISLLFTDIVMPGELTGDELARRAVAMRPGLKVLFTSGFAEGALWGDGPPPNINPQNLLSKPYRKQDLARRIRETLARSAFTP